MRKGKHRWNNDELKAAESVVWLLEHCEHPDTTIVALDAARRLPPVLVSSMIAQREGLTERLDKFCSGLLPPESLEPLQWVEELTDGVVISAMAWRYICPDGAFSHVRLPQNLYYRPPVADNIPGGSRLILRYLAIHSIRLGAHYPDDKWLYARGHQHGIHELISLLKSIDFSTMSDQILIELKLNYGMQASLFASLSTPVSLTQLALETLISSCWTFHPLQSPSYTRVLGVKSLGWDKVLWNEVPQILQAILQADSSSKNISSVALVIVSIRLVARSILHFNSYRFASNENLDADLRRNYNDLARDLHRSHSRTVWPYVEMAVSLVDGPDDEIFGTSSGNIYYTLLNLTKEMWRTDRPRNISFYAGLLHLITVYPNDLPTQELVFELLNLIPGGPPGSTQLFATRSKDNLRKPVSSLSPGVESPRSLHHEFLSWITSISDEEQFFSFFSRAHGNNDCIPVSLMTLPIIHYQLLRSDSSKSPHPQITYGYQITMALTVIEDQRQGEYVLALLYLFTCMLRGAELRWPACLPSSMIENIARRYHNEATSYHFSTGHYRLTVQDLSQEVNKVITEHNLKNSWSGECVMLLWRGACKAFLEGRLPDNWNDAAFFKENTVDTMIQYYRHMVQQQDVEMDRDTLRNYFKTALEKGWRPHGDGQPSATKNNLGEEQLQISKESLEDGSKAEVNSKGKEREVDMPPTSNGEEATQEEVSAVGKQRREIDCILSELGG
ncbi:hypothetical protein FRC02_004078 [Tulasnella sp. 418]|nr:hypothetical protein FRC02_004078 [Tulasnella sp. 418]